MSDLADRISRAAVAALDLAPFDDRFGRLSRQVLTGGASRFMRAIADDQTVHYVIPVGLVGEHTGYGALILQDHQAGLLWRDSSGLDHAAIMPREASLSAGYGPVLLDAEEWLRFDVPAEPPVSFLAPPVAGSMLDRTLISFFRAKPSPVAAVSATIVAPALPQPEPEPAEETGENTAIDLEPADGSGEHDPEATAVYTFEAGEDDDTQTDAAAAEPEEAAVPVATRALPEFPVAASAPAAHAMPTTVSIYRDENPEWSRPPATFAEPGSVLTGPVQPAPVATIVTGATAAAPPSMSRTTSGFLIGLFGVLLVGGAAIALRLLGA